MVMDHQFEVTHSQEEVPEKTIEEDDSDEWWPLGFENAGQDCPKCGSSSTRGCQQQTGSADEGMTGFHKCGDCGHDWRSGYGA